MFFFFIFSGSPPACKLGGAKRFAWHLAAGCPTTSPFFTSFFYQSHVRGKKAGAR